MSTDNALGGVAFPENQRRHDGGDSEEDVVDGEESGEDNDSSNVDNDENDGDNASAFPTTAAGAFDDDALATAAAGVTYGPTFYPTDDDFLPRPSTALDRRLWQQVLDLHAAAQQPEPLHELAILAEQQTDLLGLPPMGAVDPNNEPVDHTIGPPPNLTNATMNHLAANNNNNADLHHHNAFFQHQHQQQHDRKRPSGLDDNNYNNDNNYNLQQQQQQQQPPPKKRRVPEPQPLSHVRKQMNHATLARRAAYKYLRDVEQDYMRIQQRLEQAKGDFEKAQETLQATAEIAMADLLQEGSSWNATYRLLRNYYRKYGHTNIPRRHPTEAQVQEDPALSKLSRWVGEQRRDYRLPLDHPNRLEEYKILALQRLDFDFDPLRTAWERQYEKLKEFYQQNGHTRVPYRPSNNAAADASEDPDQDNDRDEDNGDDEERKLASLGSWVKRQRYQYKLYQEGNPASDMTQERIELLNKIQFEWQIRRTSSWEDFYQELKDYYNQHSNTLVPCSQKALYEWTQEQRQQCRLYEEDPHQSELNEEQLKQLKELGLAEDLREGKWYRRFQELLAFQRQHGHCILPSFYPYNQTLVNWVQTQRRQYKLLLQGKRSQLTPDRIRLLENDAGFEWELSSHQRSNAKLRKTWDELYAECAHHRESFGSLDGIAEDSELYRWCQEQRLQYRWFQEGQESPLTSYQKEKLDRLGLCEKISETTLLLDALPQTASWESLYADLLVYRLNHGSFNVPNKYMELHQFVKELRREYVKFKDGAPSQLNSDRIRKLCAVKFPFKAPKLSDSTSWEENFGELLSFRLQHNSFNVPKHLNEKLHKWIFEQRKMYHAFHNTPKTPTTDAKENALVEKRLEKLEEVHFPF